MPMHTQEPGRIAVAAAAAVGVGMGSCGGGEGPEHANGQLRGAAMGTTPTAVLLTPVAQAQQRQAQQRSQDNAKRRLSL